MYDVNAIKRDARMIDVAQALGISITYRGGRTLCLCPYHNDKQIGSCYITEKRLHCYSCGKDVGVIDLVMDQTKSSYLDALRFLSEMCGGKDLYGINGQNSLPSDFAPPSVIEKLGLRNAPVLKITDFTCSQKLAHELQCETAGSTVEPVKNGFVILQEAERNPLLALYKESRAEYDALIDSACQQKIDKLQNLLTSNAPQAQYFRSTADFETLYASILPKLQELEEISISYGGATAKYDAKGLIVARALASWE